jgi:putative ABC transport system ATP-binding protein
VIEIDRVSVVFGAGTIQEKRALDSLSLKLDDGEFVTVIGSNGAGKSTLLGVLAGEADIADGSVRIDGRPVEHLSGHRRAPWISRVFQDPLAGTCATLTIEENLSLAAQRGRVRGLRISLDGSARLRFQTQLERLGLGLEGRLRDPIGLLSGGQRQAISLLMSALCSSRLLLLDEHTAALDPRTAALVLGLTNEIVAEKRLTTLMVTHSMRQALDFGDRTVMLDAGKIVLDVSGAERKGLDVAGLLARFSRATHRELEDDRVLAS